MILSIYSQISIFFNLNGSFTPISRTAFLVPQVNIPYYLPSIARTLLILLVPFEFMLPRFYCNLNLGLKNGCPIHTHSETRCLMGLKMVFLYVFIKYDENGIFISFYKKAENSIFIHFPVQSGVEPI